MNRLFQHAWLAIVIAIGMLPIAAAAQPAPRMLLPSGTARLEFAGPLGLEATFHPSALEVERREVTQSSCRSCVGTHIDVRLVVQFAQGPLERVEITADVVGSAQRSFTTGWGPYPAVSSVRVWVRGRAESEDLFGRLTLDVGGRRSPTDTIVFEPSDASGFVRRMRFVVPRPPP